MFGAACVGWRYGTGFYRRHRCGASKTVRGRVGSGMLPTSVVNEEELWVHGAGPSLFGRPLASPGRRRRKPHGVPRLEQMRPGQHVPSRASARSALFALTSLSPRVGRVSYSSPRGRGRLAAPFVRDIHTVKAGGC